MNNVFITGGSGFIGRNVIELIKTTGYHIIALCPHCENDINVLKELQIDDIVFEEDLDKIGKYSIGSCIHLASYGVRYGDSNLDTMIDVNIKLASKVLNFCINNGCKLFLSAGSCFEYGTQEKEFLNEECDTRPEDLYAASKVASHLLLKTIAKKAKVKFIVCRPFGVYGRYEPSHRLFPSLYQFGERGLPLKMSGGEQLRDFLYVKDVASALYQILIHENNFKSYDVVNICSGIPCSIKEFAQTVFECNEFDNHLLEFGAIQYRQNESMRFVGENKKLVTHTAWKQKYSLREGILDYTNFLKSYKQD